MAQEERIPRLTKMESVIYTPLHTFEDLSVFKFISVFICLYSVCKDLKCYVVKLLLLLLFVCFLNLFIVLKSQTFLGL